MQLVATRLALGLVLLACVTSCRTDSFSKAIRPIEVPAGLTQEDVGVAIQVVLAEWAKRDGPESLSEAEARSIGARADYLEYRTGRPRKRQVANWYLEDFQPGRAVAGVQRGHNAMSLEVSFDASVIHMRPIHATPGLNWRGDQLHWNAVGWCLELSAALREELGTMRRYQLQKPSEVIAP